MRKSIKDDEIYGPVPSCFCSPQLPAHSTFPFTRNWLMNGQRGVRRSNHQIRSSRWHSHLLLRWRVRLAHTPQNRFLWPWW